MVNGCGPQKRGSLVKAVFSHAMHNAVFGDIIEFEVTA